MAGINYFASSPAEMTARIFQSLLLLVFVGNATNWIFTLHYLLSESPNQNERTLLAINQFATLLPLSLYLSLAFWSLGVHGHGMEFNVGGLSLAVSPLLLSFLVALLLFVIFIPYLAGSQRGRRLRSELLERRLAWLEKLKNILDQPMRGGYSRRLDAFRQNLTEEINEFVNSDPMIKIGDAIDRDGISRSAEEMIDDFKATRIMDPRFIQIDALHRLEELAAGLQSYMAALVTDNEREKGAKDWLIYLDKLKQSVSTELEEVRKADAWAILRFSGVAAVSSTIVLAVLSEIAKGLWRRYFS